MSLDEIGKTTTIVKDVVTALSIAVAAAWAVFQFSAKKEADKATADLAKVETELKTMERQLKGDANIDIEVRAKQVCSDQRNRYFIDANVLLTNKGTRSALLDFTSPRESGLFAVNLSIQPNGTAIFNGSYQPRLYTFDPARPTEPSDLAVHDIQPSVVSKLRYWIPVPSAGTYLVSFVAPMSKTDRETAQDRLKKETSAPATTVWRWHARDYVVITDAFCK
jgi:hypothetical protein